MCASVVVLWRDDWHQWLRATLQVGCIEQKSFLAMPRLLQAGRKFDFCFVDGMHLFDYTALDLFYADLLVRVGGIIWYV